MSDRRRVNFSDSPPGGSSRSSSRHGNSDSGVGSFSDHASRAGRPDHDFTDKDVERQWKDLGALQEAYRSLWDKQTSAEKEIEELKIDNSSLRKTIKEKEAQWRGICDHSDEIKESLKKTEAANTALHKRLEITEAYVAELQAQLAAASTKPSTKPPISGANPEAKPKRRESVSRHRPPSSSTATKDAAEKEAEKEKKRLSKRFEPKDDRDRDRDRGSDKSDSSNSGHSRPSVRGRRGSSYIEPMAPPPAPSSRAVPAASPTTPTGRSQYPTFSQSQHMPPMYAPPTSEPLYSKVPRTVHPTVAVHEPVFDDKYVEDGQYHIHPLPERPTRMESHRTGRHVH